VVKEKKIHILCIYIDQLSKRGFNHSKWLLEIKNTIYECGLNVMWDEIKELLNLIILVKMPRNV
jgi:hypothetical protein